MWICLAVIVFSLRSLSSGAALLPLLITTHLLCLISSPDPHQLQSTAPLKPAPPHHSLPLPCVWWFCNGLLRTFSWEVFLPSGLELDELGLDGGLCTDVSANLPFCLFGVPRHSLFNQPVTPSLLPQSLFCSHFHDPSAVAILCYTNEHYFLWKVTPDILNSLRQSQNVLHEHNKRTYY